jgi:hypothetical protein
MSLWKQSFMRMRMPTRTAAALAVLLMLGAALTMAPGPAAALGRPEASLEWSDDRGAAPEGEPGIELPPHPVLRAGESFEIRWSAADPAVDELEILLSIDGGRHFPLRISPELDARAGRYVWRVPNLSSAEARLRLRYHRGGREIDGAASAPFTLVASAEAGPAGRGVTEFESDQRETEEERAPVQEGTWWPGLGSLDLPGAAETLSSPERSISASRDLPAAGPLPSAPSPERRASVAKIRPAAFTAPLDISPSCSTERHYPLRN